MVDRQKNATWGRLFRLSWLGLIREPRFFATYIIIYGLGLFGLIAIDGFNRAFLGQLKEKSRSLISADMLLSARRALTPEELAGAENDLGRAAERSDEINLMSMVTLNNSSKLFDVRFVDEKFPLVGEFKITRMTAGQDRVWLQKNATQSEAPEIKLGSVAAKVGGVIEDDPTIAGGGFSFAPRIYLPLSMAASSGLIDKGSRVKWIYRYKIAGEYDLATIESKLKTRFPNSDVTVRSHLTASDEVGRMQNILFDYLGLVALCALFLSAVGAVYLIRDLVSRSTYELATLSAIGLPVATGYKIVVMRILISAVGACIFATILAQSVMPGLAKILQPVIGKSITVDFSWESFAVGAIISIGTSLLLALPQLIALSKLPVRALFQESRDGGIGIGKTTIWAQLPLFLLWWLLTVFQVRSFKIGSWAFLGFLSGAALTACVGFIFLRMVGASARNFSWHWRQAMLYVSRHPATSISAMLAMSLGAGLINMVPQLRITIASELLTPNTDRPSLFLFDIQDDQVEPIRDFLKKEQLSLDSISPLVRARLDAINGKSPSEVASKISGTRERDEEERFQNRAQNLSFRKDLSNSERITEGRHVSETWDGKSLASITLVDSFASRLGIKVGDELTFDVQNVAVTGVVNGLRKVRWASFQPNFFVMFQPGVLEDAPKFYLATISNLQNDAKNSLVSRLAAAFPNVSAVDLGSTIENVMKLVDQISVAMSLIAMLAVITAAAVLFAIASHQALIRQPDMRMYTMLGGSFLRLRQMALFESAMLSIMSAGVGLLLGVASTWTVSHYIFDTVWHFNGSLAAGTFFALVLLSMTVSAIATSSRLRN